MGEPPHSLPKSIHTSTAHFSAVSLVIKKCTPAWNCDLHFLRKWRASAIRLSSRLLEPFCLQPATFQPPVHLILKTPFSGAPINQLINQSISQSTIFIQSVRQSINRSINQSIDQLISQSISQSANRSIDQSISQSVISQ